MYDDLKNKVWELAEPVAVSEGMELIYVECVKMHSRWVFRLFLDKEGGVTLDDCATVSEQLGDLLDVHDLSRRDLSGPSGVIVILRNSKGPGSGLKHRKKLRG